MSVKLVDPMPFHPLLCYPGTRKPLRAVGLNASGLPLWPLFGGDGEDDGAYDEGDGEDDGDADEDAEDTDDDEGDDAGKKNGKRKKSGPVSREDFDRIQRQLSNADRRRSEAETKAAALQKEKDDRERKDKPELENLRRDVDTLTKERDSLQGKFKNLALVNAFLTASAQEKIAWHNPKVAQRAAADDLKDLEIDEEGNVEGIRDVVKALAKANKYLVNTGNTDDDDDEEKPPARRGASGSGVGSTKTAKGKGKPKGTLSDEELRHRFPALGRTR